MAVRRRWTVSRSSERQKTRRLPRLILIPCFRASAFSWIKAILEIFEEGDLESKLLKTEDAFKRNSLCTRKSVGTTRFPFDPGAWTDAESERRMISASESSNGGPKLTKGGMS